MLASPGNAGDNDSTISMELYRASIDDGTIYRQKMIKTEKDSDGIDIYEYGQSIEMAYYEKNIVIFMTRITTGEDANKHSLVAYFDRDLLRFKGLVSTAHSSDAEAIGIKILGNNDYSAIFGVELGDSFTRSIKIMEV